MVGFNTNIPTARDLLANLDRKHADQRRLCEDKLILVDSFLKRGGGFSPVDGKIYPYPEKETGAKFSKSSECAYKFSRCIDPVSHDCLICSENPFKYSYKKKEEEKKG